MSLLQVEGLTKSYTGLTAVDSVDISVEDREFLGIIGPNGAGKTTLFSLLAGSQVPTAGRIVFDDVDITGWSAQKVARTGLVRTFQLMRPFESMSVPSNTTRPDVGSWLPASSENSVVLPAPLGPMMPRNSRSSTETSTVSTAVSPAYFLVSPSTSSRLMSATDP